MLLFQLIVGTFQAEAQQLVKIKNEMTLLEGWTQDFLNKNNIPGAAVAVASNGSLVYYKSYGMANVELSVKVNKETVFEIGSMSKQFISAIAMLLVESGKLELGTPIHEYLPFLPSEWMGVTVYQLLSHTSGIPDYEEIASYDIYGQRMTPQNIIKIAHARPLDFEPGTHWNYSNTGYYLLSLVLEKIEGLPLGKILNKHIFEPLNMNQTGLSGPEKIILNRASGYWVNKKKQLINRSPTQTSSTLGAGGLLSSISDLIKWDYALYNNKLLSGQSKAFMWDEVITPAGQKSGFGLGWEVGHNMGLRAVWHSGMVAGFKSHIIRLLDEKLTIILFVNRYKVPTRPIIKKIRHAIIQ
jgi:CubicO group peptidase (beta-lactamase class C family)